LNSHAKEIGGNVSKFFEEFFDDCKVAIFGRLYTSAAIVIGGIFSALLE
jgi:hypothetical protein